MFNIEGVHTMKKIKTTVYIVFFILSIFSCKRQGSIKDYIEKGFSKPIIEGDAHFKKQSIGDEGKLYVPSEEDIEAQFTIQNKYSQELTGVLEMPQDKKSLFNKSPEIIELTPTKMVIAFNFKESAEPQAGNNFLGESVGMTVKIFDKKTGRFLSTRTLTAGCNTPPPPINADTDITYNPADDAYVVTLPQGAGKHQDLREVKFTFSSSLKGEAQEPLTMHITDVNEQGKQHTLKVQGSAKWQLNDPKGQRTIKAVVYDRAGLRSPEKTNTTKRRFLDITLIPSNISISAKKANKEGVPVPSIKELDEFFGVGEWLNKDGYTVEYSDVPNLFYDQTSNKLKKTDGFVAGETYKVKVSLTQGATHSTPVFATYTINVVGSDSAEIDVSHSIIEDATSYPEGQKPLKFDFRTLDFMPDPTSGISTATVYVDYTTHETNLKVHIVAISEDCRGKNSDGSSWGLDAYKKDYNLILGKESDQSQSVQFTIVAENGAEKIYKIVFKREKTKEVTTQFEYASLLKNSKASVKISWNYDSATLHFDLGQIAPSQKMIVAKDAMIKFEIDAEEACKIESCESTFAHAIPPISGVSTSFSLKAEDNFTLTIKLKPEASVKWDGYLKPENACGYTMGKITYNDGSAEAVYTNISSEESYAVAKDNPVKFSIESPISEGFKIMHWKVNGDKIERNKTDGSISLSDDKKTLTIARAEAKDYVVSVATKASLPNGGKLIKENEFNVEDTTTYGTDFDGNQVKKLSFERTTFTDDGGKTVANIEVPYTGGATELKVSVVALSNFFEGIDWDSSTNAYAGTGWGQDHKDYTIEVREPAGSVTQLKFKIALKTNSSQYKEYVITFTRGNSVEVKVVAKEIPNLGDAPIAMLTMKHRDLSSGITLSVSDLEMKRNVGRGHVVKIMMEPKPYAKIAHIDIDPPGYSTPNTPGEFSFEVKGNVTLTFTFAPVTSVTWKDYKTPFEGKTWYETGTITYYTPNDGTITTVNPSDSPSDKHTYPVKNGRDVVFSISDLPAEYEVKEWMVNGQRVMPQPDQYEFSEDKTRFTIKNIQRGDYKVEVVAKKVPTYTITVTFEGLKGDYPHNLKLKAKYIGASDINHIPYQSNENKYVYNVKRGANVQFNLRDTTSGKQEYDIEEWKVDVGSLSGEGFEVSINNVDSDKNIKIKLKPYYIIKLTPILDAEAGMLVIYGDSNATNELNRATMSSPLVAVEEGGDLYFKASALGTDNMVVSYKINGEEKRDFFDNTKGVWKVDNESGKAIKLDIAPGDTFEMVVARVQRILLSISPENALTTHYEGDYTVEIEKLSQNGEHYLFPNRGGNKISLTSNDIKNADSSKYPIYITKGAKIKLEVKKLDESKEIGGWKKGDAYLESGDFNKDHHNPDIIIGKNPVEYTHDGNDYGDFDLRAIIRDKTNVLTVSMKDWFAKDKNWGSEIDNNDDVEVTIESKSESQNYIPFGKIDKNRPILEKRFKKNLKFKFDAKKYGTKETYLFAMWEADGDDVDNMKGNSIYQDTLSNVSLPNRNVKIIGYYTKELIVVMHPSEEAKASNESLEANLAPFQGQYGNTEVSVRKSEFINNHNLGLASQYTLPNNKTKTLHKWKHNGQNNPNKTVLISDLGSEEKRYIVLEFNKTGFPTNKTISWKYSYGYGNKIEDNLIEADSNNSMLEGNPRRIDNHKVMLGKPQFMKDKKYPILHIYLYKAS